MSVFLLIFASAIFLAVFFVLKNICKKKIERIIGNCAGNLKALLSDGDETISMLSSDAEAAFFYSELKRIRNALRKRDDSRNEMVKIISSIATNIDLTSMLADLMPKFLSATNSNCGAFYIANQATGKLELKTSLGFSKNIYSDFDLNIGEGFIGTAALSREIHIMREIPDDTIFIFRSFLGKLKPKGIMAVPVMNQDQLLGVLLFASIYGYSDDISEIIEIIRYYVGIAVNNGIVYEKTLRLTNELKFQNKLIQNLNEELEKKASERTVFLNSIVDSIMDYAIYAMDKNGIVLAWNKGAEIIMGYKKEEIVGKPIKQLYSEEEAERVSALMEATVKNGRCEESGWRVKRDGSSYYSEMTQFAMHDNDGNLLGFTNVTKDITEMKNVETELSREKEFAKKMFKDSFRAMMLTTPEGLIEFANLSCGALFNDDSLAGKDLCALFSDGEYLRRNLLDVKNRYGRGEWVCATKENRQNISFKVAVMEIDGVADNETRLFLDLAPA